MGASECHKGMQSQQYYVEALSSKNGESDNRTIYNLASLILFQDNDSESFAETVADLTRDSKELKTTDILIFTTALEGLVRNATIEENVQVYFQV